MRVVDLGRGGDGLPVGHLRRADVGLDLELPHHAVDDDLEVEGVEIDQSIDAIRGDMEHRPFFGSVGSTGRGGPVLWAYCFHCNGLGQ